MNKESNKTENSLSSLDYTEKFNIKGRGLVFMANYDNAIKVGTKVLIDGAVHVITGIEAQGFRRSVGYLARPIL